MDDNLIPLGPEDPFGFSCSKNISCFTECCGDLNQFLTPYDILRLKNRLGISSGQFLEEYTIQHTGPETGLPVVSLKPVPGPFLRCPFVREQGCEVYEDRPSSCRTYPLVRLASRSRETGVVSERFFLLKEPHCLGFNDKSHRTVRAYISEQGLDVYNHMNDLMMEIISLKNMLRPGPLDAESKFCFHLAFYDLDGFRSRISENNILGDFKTVRDPAEQDDPDLLKLGQAWIKYKLFAMEENS